MSPAPTARARRWPVCAPSRRPRACASTSSASPHLVRFNEPHPGSPARRSPTTRPIVDLLAEVERVNAGAAGHLLRDHATVAAFLAFARRPADLTLLEVGIGGRLDATNVVRAAAREP
jgi:dihydrofolate synthase/folylpolyglutamate synthase